MRYRELIEKSQAERKADVGVEADQFFTRPEIAEKFANWIIQHNIVTGRVIEPATGSKDLAKHFPGIEMYDLFPQSPDITAQDFLTSNMGYKEGTTVVMNPPYGNNSALAIKFFNKAAEIADHIAMIVPRTFRRPSIQNRMAAQFHLVDEFVLPRNSFYLAADDKMRPYDVPAVAQIWSKKDEERELQKPQKTSQQFKFVKPEQADFAFRRKGRRAGQVVDNPEGTNPNSFYYVKGDQRVLNAFKNVDWTQLGNDVMGARSISMSDIVKAVEQKL